MKGRFSSPMIIIGILFFVFGFITWLGSVLIPYLKIACQLNNTSSMLVAFAFYISYFIMAIPSFLFLKWTGYKRGMSLGLLIMAAGSLLFIPAAMSREYYLFLTGLFVQGIGMTILQTAANPYVTILGARESAARRMSIMGICNGIAATIAPLILGAVALKDADGVAERVRTLKGLALTNELNQMAQRVILPYAIMAVALFLLAILVHFSGLPEIESEPEEEQVPDTAGLAAIFTEEVTASREGVLSARAAVPVAAAKSSVLQFPHLLLGVFTLALYVGVEVIAGDTVIGYGSYQGVGLSASRYFSSFTQVNMLVGYLLGILLIPKYLNQENALRYSSLLGIVFAVIALSIHGVASVLFVSFLGFANALIWPSIWPLALAGLGKFTKTGSALLIMAIGGGAVLPLLYGHLADLFNKQAAYWMVIPIYLVILLYSWKGHKIRTR